MSERLVLLPGWSYPAASLQLLADALKAQAGGTLQVELAELPARKVPKDWLGELDARLPANSWLGGWSLGGMLAAELAARRGGGCPGLITLASNATFLTRAGWPSAMLAEQFAAFREDVAKAPALALKRFDLLVVHDADEPRVLARRLAARPTAQQSRQALLAGLDCLASLDMRVNLKHWHGPCLHLLGGRDALVPVGAVPALRAEFPGARVELLEDAGHALPLSHAAEAAGHMLSFYKAAS